MLMASFQFLTLPHIGHHKMDVIASKNASLIYHGFCEVLFDRAMFPCEVEITLTSPSLKVFLKRIERPDHVLDVFDALSSKTSSYRKISLWVSKLKPTELTCLECSEKLNRFWILWHKLKMSFARHDDTTDEDKKKL